MMASISHLKKPPSSDLIRDIALEMGIDPAFIEKDWYAVQLLSRIADFHPEKSIKVVFGGGTSLSKGFCLIKRFSEDLDFFLDESDRQPLSRNQRRAYRRQLISYLTRQDGYFSVDDAYIERGNNNRFFKAPLTYTRLFAQSTLRPHLQMEMTFMIPELAPETRAISSIIAEVTGEMPETEILCISPFETAADKLSALSWRILVRNRKGRNDDPTMIRHLHDLAALSAYIEHDLEKFVSVAKTAIIRDIDRRRGGDIIQDLTPVQRIERLLETLKTDPVYEKEYETFVLAMSYADDAERLSFDKAIRSLEVLVNRYLDV